jgi:hypothetical protein
MGVMLLSSGCVAAHPSVPWSVVPRQYHWPELEARQAREKSPLWADGDDLTLYYQVRPTR